MTTVTIKRFTVAEYDYLAELGFLTEDDRVELICGQIIEMAAKGKLHSTVSRQLLRELSKLIDTRATLQSQDPIILLHDSEPEPDFAILKNRSDNYLAAHPNADDILLLIEISDSSLKYDQEVKLPLYAESGISDYWIFNLGENCLEVYSKPYQKPQGQFGYCMKRIVLVNEAIALPCFPDLSLDLAKIFPGNSDQ